jgi:hypothetical protein
MGDARVSYADVVVLVVLAFAVGAALGMRYRPSAPVDAPAPLPPPPEEHIVGRPGLSRALHPRAEELARAILMIPGGDDDPDPMRVAAVAEVIREFGGDTYAQGITELRAALALHSGLPPELVDQACDIALEVIEEAGRAA